MSGVLAKGFVAATIILGSAATAAAQSVSGLGSVSRDPVAATQAEVASNCGPVGIPVENVSFGDFTGDGREDVVILVDVDCRSDFSYCAGTRGCSNRIWVGQADGQFRWTNDVLANEARVATFEGRPAIQFDGGPVWAWTGTEFALASGGSVAGDGRTGRPPRTSNQNERPSQERSAEQDGVIVDGRDFEDERQTRARRPGDEDVAALPDDEDDFYRGEPNLPQDGYRYDDEDVYVDPDEALVDDDDDAYIDDRHGGFGGRLGARPPLHQDRNFDKPYRGRTGEWTFELFGDSLARATVTNFRGGRFTVGCLRGFGELVIRVFPDRGSRGRLPVGRGRLLVDFRVDGARADTRLLRRRGYAGPLVDLRVAFDSRLIRRLKAGSEVAVFDEGHGARIGGFSLQGSSRAINRLIEACR